MFTFYLRYEKENVRDKEAFIKAQSEDEAYLKLKKIVPSATNIYTLRITEE